MNRLFLLLGTLLLIMACAKNQVEQVQADDTSDEPLSFTAPGWVWQIPAGGYALGITYADSHYSEGAQDIARDFAAVSLSRNHASFIVDKSLVLSLAMQEEIDWKKVNFNVVVSADLDFLRKASEELKLLDSHEVSGYFLGLYGFLEVTLKTELRSSNPAQLPDWCAQTTYTDKNTLYSVASSQQATLLDAWNLAHELALRQIAQYRLQNVVAQIRATEDTMQRNVAIETVTRSQNVYFDRSFILPIRRGNTTTYKVYLQMMTAVNP